MNYAVFIGVTILYMTRALAADVQPIYSCSGIQDNFQRLACYDLHFPQTKLQDEKFKPKPVYQRLEAFTLRLIDNETYLQTEIHLKINNESIRQDILSRMPEVQNAVLQLLGTKKPSELDDSGDRKRLAEEIGDTVCKLIGQKSGCAGALYSAFILQ